MESRGKKRNIETDKNQFFHGASFTPIFLRVYFSHLTFLICVLSHLFFLPYENSRTFRLKAYLDPYFSCCTKKFLLFRLRAYTHTRFIPVVKINPNRKE